jgi:hypothetical protein
MRFSMLVPMRPPAWLRLAAMLGIGSFALVAPRAALGESRGRSSGSEAAPVASGIGRPRDPGHPKVILDGLVFPESVANTASLERHFKHMLRRAARRADWGAGRGARIEYRVVVEELAVAEVGGVLRVRCTALGRLPRGKSARSHLDFGGDPKNRRAVVERVLEIVARGVVTRLAALERERRRSAAR